jgi:hypothetical protein
MGDTQRVKRQACDSQSCQMLRQRAFLRPSGNILRTTRTAVRSDATETGSAFFNGDGNARESRRDDDIAKPNVQAPNTIDTRLPDTTARGCSKGGRRLQ